jgi:hypothetical protein
MASKFDMQELKSGEWEHIQNDCLYAKTFQRHQQAKDVMAVLRQAGYIFEARSSMDHQILKDTGILSMPLKARCANNRPAAVLVSTGSYSPIHAGHVGIMEVAKKHIESLGYQVVQGVISPSHDAYVSIKYGGKAKMHVGIRAQRIFEAVETSDWLVQDRMEGEMLSCAVNFSTVLEHVRLYLMAHHPDVSESTPVFYVYGSDNAGFSEAFIGNEPYHGICVARADASLEPLREQYACRSNLHFIAHNESFGHHSSTRVRAEVDLNPIIEHSLDKGLYLVRADDVPRAFADALSEIIARHIEPGVEIKVIDSSDFSLGQHATVSLDKYVSGQYNLDVSRVFEISAGQIKAKGMTSLSQPLENQVGSIAPGEYTLVDDDSITGFTMEQVEQAMEQIGARVIGRDTLIGQVLGDRPLYDIVDARDFLVTAPKGGLVVQHQGKHIRAPYLFPFVNVVTRARILPERQHAFCRAVYALNLPYVSNHPIASLEPCKRDFFALIGNHTSAHDFCQFYLRVIDNLIQSYPVTERFCEVD